MGIATRWIVLLCLGTLPACGTGAIFETEEARQARVEAAVAEALRRERGWQTRFVERRTETMLGEQTVLGDRMAGLERMAHDIADRLDAIERAAPDTSQYVDGRALSEAQATREAERAAEIASLQRDIAALTGAVARLSTADRQGEAAVRARLERLELRTSKMDWPTPSSDVRAVHLASYRSHEAALAGWEVLSKRYREALADETPTLVAVRTVAGEYVRLFTGAGHDGPDLLKIREALRDGGDYAMILPLPGGAGS